MKRLNTKQDRLDYRAALVATKPGAQLAYEADDGSQAFTYQTANGKPALITFMGGAGKPSTHYSFYSEASRAESLKHFQGRVESNATYKAEKTTNRIVAKVGDILNTSWGYDQTNVSFYLVTAVSKTGASVKLSEMSKNYVPDGHMSGKVVPDAGSLDPIPGWKRLGQYGVKIHDSATASPWDGSPQYVSSYH